MSVRGKLSGVRGLPDQVAQLEARVAELEGQLAESQALHQRFAEVLDVVTELLVPLADRDQARIQETLRTYVDELGS